MLTGQELIDFVKANEDINKTALAKAAGYVRETESGKEQVLVKVFYDALLTAQGLNIKVGKSPGKVAQFETTVHKNGVVLLGRTYTERFGINPGDVLEIVIEDDAIRLVPKAV
jgi:hypothetical protein